MTVAAAQIQNLMYVIGALLAASLWISGLYLVRHRKPKSVEAGIESFSRELRALAPERRPVVANGPTGRAAAPPMPAPTVRPVPAAPADADRPAAGVDR